MNNFSWRLLSEWTKSLAGSGPLHGRTRGVERQVEFCRWLHLAEYEVGSCGDERLIWVIDGVPKSASQWGRDFVPTALMRRMRGDREGRVIAECCMMSQFPSNIHSHIAPGHMLMAEARYNEDIRSRWINQKLYFATFWLPSFSSKVSKSQVVANVLLG